MKNMTAESNAFAHLNSFRWWQDQPDISEEEALFRDAVALSNELHDLLAIRARDAHDSGMTWAEVASVLGITRQAASSRFTNPIIRSQHT